MKPGKLQKAGLLFRFEVERVHHVILTLHIIKQYGGRDRRTVHVW